MPLPFRYSGPKLHRLLVATDFDAASDAAVEMGAALARDASAFVHLLYVIQAPAPPGAGANPKLPPEATCNMANAVRHLHELGVESVTSSIEFGIPADVIVRHASSTKFDLLVLGGRGKGSTSKYVVMRVRIPVMVIPFRST